MWSPVIEFIESTYKNNDELLEKKPEQEEEATK